MPVKGLGVDETSPLRSKPPAPSQTGFRQAFLGLFERSRFSLLRAEEACNSPSGELLREAVGLRDCPDR
jgi:hypothetical protein